MSMMDHLVELRTRLIYSAIAFLVTSIFAFIIFEPITNILLRPLCSLPPERLGPQGCNLIFTGALEPFAVRIKVATLVGIILASPVWLYQLWRFITPGLTEKEKRYAFPFVGSSITLFLVGGTMAYLTLPAALQFLVGLGGANFIPFFRASDYLSFVSLIILAFGATFEIPLLVFFLGLVGVVKVEQLRRFRKGALVTSTALGAVVTPSQDPYTMLAMAVPLYAFYELATFALGRIDKRKKKAAGAEAGEA
jgi:sec-independent protein translocase protein TatC